MNKIIKARKKILLGGFIATAILGVVLFSDTGAQSATILITWRTQTYVPRDFPGKALPIPGSPITASLEAIVGGKTADLSNTTIYWYLDGHQIGGGTGVWNMTLQAPSGSSGVASLRAQIENLAGARVAKTIYIPVVSPEAIIESPYYNGQFSGESANVKAMPYFFSVADPSRLSFSWLVNGESSKNSGNPDELSVKAGGSDSGTAINIFLTITNPLGASESALTGITLKRK